MHIKLDKKGMTLVEVLVASALLVVLIAIAGGLILSTMNNSTRYARNDQAKQLGLAIYNYYEGRLQNGAEIVVVPDGDDASAYITDTAKPAAIRSNGSIVEAKAIDSTAFVDLYSEDTYNRMTVNTAVYVAGVIMHLQVDILYENEVIFSKKSAFRLATMYRLGTSVKGDLGSETAQLINPTIYYLP